MQNDRDAISHEESDDGSIETEHDADVYLEKGHSEGENQNSYVISDVGLLFTWLAFELHQEILSGDKT